MKIDNLIARLQRLRDSNNNNVDVLFIQPGGKILSKVGDINLSRISQEDNEEYCIVVLGE